MIRLTLTLACVLLLGGCMVRLGGDPLVSAQSPPNASSGSEPQPAGSFPPGVATPVAPNDAAVTIPAF